MNEELETVVGQRDYLAARVLELEQAAEEAGSSDVARRFEEAEQKWAKERDVLEAKLVSSQSGIGDKETKMKIRIAELEGSNKLLATKVQEIEMKLQNSEITVQNFKMEVEKAKSRPFQ